MDKKIRKFTYSFQYGSWGRMFGGMIWGENGKIFKRTYIHITVLIHANSC